MINLLRICALIAVVGCQTVEKSSDSNESTPDNRAKIILKSVELPKIGLILGPGGAKAFAHVGVLREFEKSNIKIHAITGLEWGALIGSIYSMKGRSNDLEWQLSKFKDSDLPNNGSFNSTYDSSTVRKTSKYLDQVFNNSKIEAGSIPFSCPSVFLNNGKVAWWDQGLIKPAIEKCLSFPPIYQAHRGWVAGSFEVQEAAKRLREAGAEIIVFVNVLARGTILKNSRSSSQTENEIIWWEGVKRINASHTGIDWIVGIHTRKYDILDFDSRQSFILFGQEFGAAAAKKINEQYGL